MRSVLAFDPGQTTGWCYMTDTGVWLMGEIDCRDEILGVQEMLGMCGQYQQSAVVFEDFILDPGKATMGRELLSPVRVTAMFEFGHAMTGYGNYIFLLNRSLVKSTCTDSRLKGWGLYDKHSGPHARDATRYAYYMLREWHAIHQGRMPIEVTKREPGERI